MSSPVVNDATGATYTTTTTTGTVLTYSGPGGTFPAASICSITVMMAAYDATGGGKTLAIWDVAVHNIGGTLTLITAGAQSARIATTVGVSQATGGTFSISGSNLLVTNTRSSNGNSIQYGVMVAACSCITP